jgi:hypothetical protein
MNGVCLQGTLTEGEGSIQLTSLYYFRSAAFGNSNIIYFFLQNMQP